MNWNSLFYCTIFLIFKPIIILAIIRGDEVEPHSAPWQAWLILTDKKEEFKFNCSGSLITKNYVLTSAYYLSRTDIGLVEVILGAHNVTADEASQQRIIGSEIKSHPNFKDVKGDRLFDIALVKLQHPASLNNYIKVVKLPTGDDSYEGLKGTATGWGITKKHAKKYSPVLLSLEAAVENRSFCYDIFYESSDLLVCINSDRMCIGDNGDPLVIKGVQIGVANYGAIYCSIGYPSTFTRVSKFMEWIKENSDIITSDNN